MPDAPGGGRRRARRAALFLLYQHDVTGRPYDELLRRHAADTGAEVPAYARRLVDGVEARRAPLDEEIARHAVGWSVDRIAPVEGAALRIAAWEILHGDVPAAVAIDEAVSLARRYGSPEAGVFVNGILGALVRAHGLGR